MKKPEYGICIRYYFISIKCLDFDQYPVLIEKFLFLKKKTKVFMDEGAWYLQITQGSEIYKQGAHMNGNTKGAKCNDWWIKVKSAGGFFVVFLVKKNFFNFEIISR